jgi:hypothetical protein
VFYLILVHIWEDNIKMDLQEVGVVCGDWMELDQDRARWQTCEYGKESSGFIKIPGISGQTAKTGQLLKKDCAPRSK